MFFVMAPVFAYGATYYVGKTGSDFNDCTQARSVSSPKFTINAGLRCLQGGDTLIIQAGIYTEGIGNTAIPGGRPRARTVVRSAAGETVIINGVNTTDAVIGIYDRSYITIDGIVVDGHRVIIGGNGPAYAHFITIQNSVIRNNHLKSCVTQQGPAGSNSNLRFLNNEIYNCGTTTGHGIYLTARDSVVEGNRIHNAASYGIHVYNEKKSEVNNNIIRYNEVYSNGAFGILVSSGINNQVYGNIVRNNRSGGILVGLKRPEKNSVYHNKIYNNNGYCIRIRADAIDSKVHDNACRDNARDTILDEGMNSSLSKSSMGR
jgi:parallel beta-helix repeat protein